MTDNQPWSRQLDESGKAFDAFCAYRDLMPRERSLQVVSQKYAKSEHYINQLKRWSSRYHWVGRVKAYDTRMAEVRCQASEDSAKEMAERQVREAMALQTAGLQKFIDKVGNVREEVVANLRERDAIMAITEGAKLERMARGQPGEIQRQELDLDMQTVRELKDFAQRLLEQQRKELTDGKHDE
jgi:hypothetical protein